MFGRREFKNEATEWMESHLNDGSVSDLLCQSTIGQAVESFPKVVDDFLNSPSRSPTEDPGRSRLEIIAQWALTTKYNTEEINKTWKIFQLNRNAASILCSPARALQKRIAENAYIKELVHEFYRHPNKSPKVFGSQNPDPTPILMGHFQRIVGILLCALSDEDKSKFLEGTPNLVEFCVENISYVACQSLLVQLAVDFQVRFPKRQLFETIFEVILKKAGCYVFTIHEILQGDPDEDKRLSQSLCNTRKGEQVAIPREKLDRQQPLMARKDKNGKPVKMPYPDFTRIDRENASVVDSPENAEKKSENMEFVGYRSKLSDDLTECQHQAYCLLGVIRSACNEDQSLVDLLQTEKALRYLMICGVYSDSVSMVSQVAFWLLKLIVYGSDKTQWILYKNEKELKDSEDDGDFVPYKVKSIYDEVQEILREYAQLFRFSEVLTPQMIAAFPLFWNYRYENLDTQVKFDPIEVHLITDPSKGGEDKILETYTKPPGTTPLEYYVSFLFDEPPISDAFNREIVTMFVWQVNQAHAHRATWSEGNEHFDDEEWQKKMNEMDKVILEVLRAKFTYCGEKLDMTNALDIMPLDPQDPYYKEVRELIRAPVNGIHRELAWIKDTDAFYYGIGPAKILGPFGYAQPFGNMSAAQVGRWLKAVHLWEALQKFFDRDGVRHNCHAGACDPGDGMGEICPKSLFDFSLEPPGSVGAKKSK